MKRSEVFEFFGDRYSKGQVEAAFNELAKRKLNVNLKGDNLSEEVLDLLEGVLQGRKQLNPVQSKQESKPKDNQAIASQDFSGHDFSGIEQQALKLAVQQGEQLGQLAGKLFAESFNRGFESVINGNQNQFVNGASKSIARIQTIDARVNQVVDARAPEVQIIDSQASLNQATSEVNEEWAFLLPENNPRLSGGN